VEIVDPPSRSAFRLKRPWLDFMTLLRPLQRRELPGSSPKKYVEKVGDDGIQESAGRRPGLISFVSFKPGVELVVEANEGVLAQDFRA